MIVNIWEIVRERVSFAINAVILMAVVPVPRWWRQILQPHPLIYAIEAPDKVHVSQITTVDYSLLVSSA